MPVVTVSRQYASGGSAIAKTVAQELGWTVVDNEFVDRVAERIGLPPEEVARREERVEGLIERFARTLATSSPELFLSSAGVAPEEGRSEADLVRITEAVINEAAQAPGGVVLVGRGAHAYLAEQQDALHVHVVAPRAVRVESVRRRRSISTKEAERIVDSVDEGRRDYARQHYHRSWDAPENYHLVVNTALVPPDAAAALVVEMVRRSG